MPFQTYIGSILCAINPYKTIPGIYGDDVMQVYNKKHIGECPPHIFAIANDCYYSMWKKGENQCVLIRWVLPILCCFNLVSDYNCDKLYLE